MFHNRRMKYGYACTRTDGQTNALQLDAFKKAGAERLFEDKGIRGAVTKRPALARLLKTLRSGCDVPYLVGLRYSRIAQHQPT